MHKTTEWMRRGTCATAENKDLWFPEVTKNNTFEVRQAVQEAKRICADCPVRKQCAEYAVTFPTVLQGVWAGMTQRQIRVARVARGIKAESEHEFSQLPVEGKGYYSEYK